jgi:hypothetical protein
MKMEISCWRKYEIIKFHDEMINRNEVLIQYSDQNVSALFSRIASQNCFFFIFKLNLKSKKQGRTNGFAGMCIFLDGKSNALYKQSVNIRIS